MEQDSSSDVRNVVTVGPVDHGVSTLTNALRKAGAPEGVRLNFIDAPPQEAPGTDVAALREADGALVVIDIVEGGPCSIHCGKLRQCLSQARSIKPVLVLNKLDRAFLELQLEEEEIYLSMCRCVESVNSLIVYSHQGGGEPRLVEPDQGTVAFASGLHGWGFSLPTFAEFLGQKLGVAPARILKRLWGDNFFDADAKKWLKTNVSPTTGKRLPRGFCYLVLRPIRFILTACLGGPEQREALDQALLKLGIELQPAEKALQGKDLMKCVMPKFLPLSTARHPTLCPPSLLAHRADARSPWPCPDSPWWR